MLFVLFSLSHLIGFVHFKLQPKNNNNHEKRVILFNEIFGLKSLHKLIHEEKQSILYTHLYLNIVIKRYIVYTFKKNSVGYQVSTAVKFLKIFLLFHLSTQIETKCSFCFCFFYVMPKKMTIRGCIFFLKVPDDTKFTLLIFLQQSLSLASR